MGDRRRPTGSDSVQRSDGGGGRFLTRQEATGTYASLIGRGGRVVAVGDSQTANYGASNGNPLVAPVYNPDNPFDLACMLNKQAPRWDGVYATGGYTLEQIRDTHIPTVLAKSPLPAGCVILGGRNNAAANNGAGFSVAATLAVLDQIVTTLRAAGVVPIVCTVPPAGDSSTVNNNIQKYNRALHTYCATKGIDLADYNRALVDPATGGFRTGLGQTDNVHPSFKGVGLMAAALAPVLAARFASVAPPLGLSVSDTTNLLGSSGLFTADTNADGIADGWSSFSGSNYTFTVQTDADGYTKWQRIAVGTTSTGSGLLQWSASSLVTPGDVIELCARVQTSGFTAAQVAPASGGSGGTGPSWGLTCSITGYGNDALAPAYTVHNDIADGVLYARLVVPAGATGQLKVNISTTGAPASGSCYVQVANVALRNLTTLGQSPAA